MRFPPFQKRRTHRLDRLQLIIAFLGGWIGALYLCNCKCTFEGFRQQTQIKPRLSKGSTSDTTQLRQQQQQQSRTAVLFMTGSNDEYRSQKVKELAEQFGDDFWVIWGPNPKKDTYSSECPHKAYARCIEQWDITETKKLSHRCCSQEKAIMWAMFNRNDYDYIWFMEDDVHYTDMDALLETMNNQEPDADVVNQERIYRAGNWWYANQTRTHMKKVFTDEQLDQFHGHAMMNFFRFSRRYLDTLDQVFLSMDSEWTFFEGLFPTVAQVYGYKWVRYARPIFSMRNRPCVTEFNEPGIYHPVKFRNGQPFPCHCFDSHCHTFPDKPECLPCAEIRAANIFDLSQNEKVLAGLVQPESPTANMTVTEENV